MIILKTSSFSLKITTLLSTLILLVSVASTPSFSQEAPALSEESLEIIKGISPVKGGALPESYVSIAVKLPDGSFHHLMGGFLLHPGVVLTTLSTAIYRYHVHQLGLDENFVQGEFYVIFSLPGKRGKVEQVPIPVKEAVSNIPLGGRSLFGRDPSLSVLFFETTDKIKHIKPIPLANTGDLEDVYKASGDDLWVVGVKGYEGEFPLKNKKGHNICPDPTYTKVGAVNLSATPEEYMLVNQMISLDPGAATPFLTENLVTKGSDGNLTFTPPASDPTPEQRKNIREHHISRSCNSDILCTEPSSPFKASLDIQFQCAEHVGYPALWRSPSGIWKILGSTITTHYLWSPDLEENPGKSFKDFFKWYDTKALTPDFFKTSKHYDLVFSHSTLIHALNYYNASNKDPNFNFDEEIISSWDLSLENALIFNKHFNFMVNISAKITHKDEDKSAYLTLCRGSVISDGVILTTANCLLSDASVILNRVKEEERKNFTVETVALFRDEEDTQKVVEIPPQFTYVHEQYQKAIKNKDTSAPLPDLGLFFYDPSQEDLPSIPSIALPSHEISDKKPLYSLSSHALDGMNESRVWPHVYRNYRWIEHRLQVSARDEIKRKMQYFFNSGKRQEKKVSEWLENITGKKADIWDLRKQLVEKPNPYLELIDECAESPVYVCTTINEEKLNRVERMRGVCEGDMGAPLMQEDKNKNVYLVGVVTGLRDRTFAKPCSSEAVSIKTAPFVNWIIDSVKNIRKGLNKK